MLYKIHLIFHFSLLHIKIRKFHKYKNENEKEEEYHSLVENKEEVHLQT
jgi:hypothetical protein